MNHSMKHHTERIVAFGFLIFAFLLLVNASAFAEDELLVESTNIIVYRDGLVHINQRTVVNQTDPSISLPLLSSLVNNLIILDQNQKSLDYSISDLNITIFTLGTERISIEYDTTSLTNKDAEVWTLNIESPYNSTVHLPKNATIVYLNQIPGEIDTIENRIIMNLFPDLWEISYILPLISPSDPSDNTLNFQIFPIEYLIIGTIVIATLLLLVFIFIKRRRPNIGKLVKAFPQLRQEEIDVIHFLNEEGGKAFESQIRERFPDLPRTSLWRLIRRLEKNEIVRIKKIGLENQVELK